MQRFPELRPLVVFTKRLLSQHGLNEVFSGGLSSYAIFHLALSFLRTRSGRDSHGACPQGCPQFPFFINGEEGARSEKQRGLQFPADELCQAMGACTVLDDIHFLKGGHGRGGRRVRLNTTKYPRGMRWLGDQVHSLGLHFGMYSDAGPAQCCSRGAGFWALRGWRPRKIQEIRAERH